MTRAAMLLLLGAATGRVALAQSAGAAPAAEHPATPRIVHYGKWGAAAMFVGFTALGVIEHRDANNAFSRLQTFCHTPNACTIGSDGRYANPAAESRYQEVVRGDRAARGWLVGGQVALAGATAMFVVELLKEHGTRNIPFQGLTITPGRFGYTLYF